MLISGLISLTFIARSVCWVCFKATMLETVHLNSHFYVFVYLFFVVVKAEIGLGKKQTNKQKHLVTVCIVVTNNFKNVPCLFENAAVLLIKV